MTSNHQKSRVLCGLVAVAVLGGRALSQDFEIGRYSFTGGATSTGGAFSLSGSVAEPTSGAAVSGGTFEVSGGFWIPQPPGDCNADGLLNLFDYDDFEPCLDGPGLAPIGPCGCFDLDGDADVDLVDFALLQEAF